MNPSEVKNVIEKTTGGNATEFARRLGINPALMRRYRSFGVKNLLMVWALNAIDKNPALLGGNLPPGKSEFDKGMLTIIAKVIATNNIQVARVMLLEHGLEKADISSLPAMIKIPLFRLNSYHGIDLHDSRPE